MKHIYRLKSFLSLVTISFFILLTLQGCAMQSIEDYQGATPKADIRQYLSGNLLAYGSVHDWRGKLRRSFTVKMTGTWQGNTGTLEEHFVFNDGEEQTRIWKITMQNDHEFTATAADVKGIAIGKQMGNAINMKYQLDVPVNDSSIVLTLDDWLYLINDKYLINRTKMKKFGITVGTLTIGFEKLGDE